MLLDTNVLICYGRRQKQLSSRAVKLVREAENFYSHVSVWELAIKSSVGKIELLNASGQRTSARSFLLKVVHDLQLRPLPIEFDDLAEVETLPRHHGDPFDRLLIVQAMRRNLPIISSDEQFDDYGVKRVW
jgi:PIN domain nuclease of toxin-antitoxin system